MIFIAMKEKVYQKQYNNLLKNMFISKELW